MKQKRVKFGQVTPRKRCRFCLKEIPLRLDLMHAHVLQYHLEDLAEIGVPQEELEIFKLGFRMEYQ